MHTGYVPFVLQSSTRHIPSNTIRLLKFHKSCHQTVRNDCWIVTRVVDLNYKHKSPKQAFASKVYCLCIRIILRSFSSHFFSWHKKMMDFWVRLISFSYLYIRIIEQHLSFECISRLEKLKETLFKSRWMIDYYH